MDLGDDILGIQGDLSSDGLNFVDNFFQLLRRRKLDHF
jgi:hypothetical protein